MGPEDENIVPEDLEGSCNMVSYIWSFEGKTYCSIYYNLILVTVKVELN